MSFRGQSLPRLEDARFLTGRGQYIEDIDIPGADLDAGRALAARARNIRAYRHRRSAEVAGVLGVFTAADLGDLGPLPCNVPVASLAPMIVPPRLALASGRARHVGDPVAFVVAETRAAARDAAELLAWIGSLCPRWLMARRHCWRARRGCGSRRRTICPIASRRATRTRCVPRSPARRMSSNWNWSTIGSSSPRWNRAARSPGTMVTASI